MTKQTAYETAKAKISKTAKDPKDYEKQIKELARRMGI